MVFDAELKILYIVTIKLGNVELEPYYGTNTTYTFSGDGTNTIKIKPSNANEQSITINNVIQAANATNAENDSDGNKISSTYLKLTGGTVSGNLVVSGTSNIDDLQAASLLISGQSKFLNEIEGTSKYSTHLGTNSNNYTYESLSTILAQKADKSSIPGSELITDRSKYADAIRTPDYRAPLTSMNQTFSDSALHYFLANINYCTEGKPTFNSGVIHAAWSSSNYAAQLALPNDTNGNIQWRYEDGANNWSKWFNVIDDNNWFKYIGTTKNPVGNATNAALASKATSADSATSAITATTADKVSKSLKWGSKTYNGSSEQTITAADLGLSGAMHFLGVTTSNINEGSTLSSIIIDGKSVTQSKGDVVLYSHSEYIWTGSKWEELGSEQSFALKSVEISAGNGLTGGGTLEATRIISHADTSSQKSITTGGRTYINKIELDDFGHVTSLSTGTEADQIDISGNAATATRLRVNNVGSDEQPVYFKNGVPVTISKFTGTSSNSNYLNCIDTRNINDDPYVQKNQLRYELKSAYTVGISSGTYVGLLSLCPWNDSSGGYHYQVAFGLSGIQYRSGLDKWSDWNMFAVKSDIPTKLSQLTDDLGDAPSHTHKQYALKAGDTITGKYKFTAGLESDSITTEDLIVNGSAKFISGITSDSNIIAPTFTGNLKGNADTASSANVANKVGANLTITNGSNTVTYDGSAAKSITITSGTNYELTADKMSTAWESNTVSGESLFVTSITSKNMTNDCDFTINGSSIELINNATADAGIKIDIANDLSAGNTGYEHTGVCTGSYSKIAVSSSTLPDFANLATYMDASGVFTGGRMNAAGGFFQTSDARKKDFGSNVEIDFNALKSIPKKYFEWKDNPEAGQQIGTSAQDLLRVYPSLVNKDKNGYYSVDYARLSIVALAAIDKLNDKIEELENKIESLERR